MLQNEGRKFWAEIKRMKASSAFVSKSFDGISDSANIWRLFADKYRDLYTAVNYDNDEM